MHIPNKRAKDGEVSQSYMMKSKALLQYYISNEVPNLCIYGPGSVVYNSNFILYSFHGQLNETENYQNQKNESRYLIS